MSRNYRLYLNDIVMCCDKILAFTSGMTREQFLADVRTYDAVLRNLEIIGEAAKRLPEVLLSQIPDVEWKNIKGMRDWLAHGYFGIEDSVVWAAISGEVRPLRDAVDSYRATLPSGDEVDAASD